MQEKKTPQRVSASMIHVFCNNRNTFCTVVSANDVTRSDPEPRLHVWITKRDSVCTPVHVEWVSTRVTRLLPYMTIELLSWIVASTLVVVIRSSNATLQAALLLNPPVNVAMVDLIRVTTPCISNNELPSTIH